MRILITTVQVPFVRGGAEVLAEGLHGALVRAGHEAEIAAVPFKWYPPERILDQMLACRLLDITESTGVAVDRVIALKFPAYFIPHPSKVVWLLHQHRSAYDLWSHKFGDLVHFPNGAQVRDAIHEADRRLLPEAKAIYTIAGNVSHRLKKYCDLESTPLYHPPQNDDQFYCADTGDYFFYPSRLGALKRQGLVIEALAHTTQPVRVRFAGTGDGPATQAELQAQAKQLGVADRIEWLGRIDDARKIREYAGALAVIFPPLDEDYGYVTLEAMLAHKAVITCRDSGGPLEFVVDGETGLVTEPTATALAAALDRLWEDRRQARAMGEAGRARYAELNISWDTVVQRLAA